MGITGHPSASRPVYTNPLRARGFSDVPDVYKGEHRVLKVGYPGDSKEVGRKAISSIRKACSLLPENGVDAEVFFKGEDPLQKLIGEYEEPLKRLAER